MKSGVYQIQNRSNGYRYIGSAVNVEKRWQYHRNDAANGMHHSRYFQRAWDVYGDELFEFSKLLSCPPEWLIRHEQSAINFFKPEYNMSSTAGSSLGMVRSEETRQKMKTRRPGCTMSAESRKKISIGLTGITRGPETRAKMGLAKKGVPLSAEHCQKLSLARLGKPRAPHTVETRAKMSRSRRAYLDTQKGVL